LLLFGKIGRIASEILLYSC